MGWLNTISTHCLLLRSPSTKVLAGLLSFWIYEILVTACSSPTHISISLHWEQPFYTIQLCFPSHTSLVGGNLTKLLFPGILDLGLRETGQSLYRGWSCRCESDGGASTHWKRNGACLQKGKSRDIEMGGPEGHLELWSHLFLQPYSSACIYLRLTLHWVPHIPSKLSNKSHWLRPANIGFCHR